VQESVVHNLDSNVINLDRSLRLACVFSIPQAAAAASTLAVLATADEDDDVVIVV
jgi:hypothetical protein